MIGYIIAAIAVTEGQESAEGKQIQKQVNNLFEQVLERVLDVSGNVRVKAFNVMSRIIEIKGYRFPKQRLQMTTAVVEALEDKSPLVRKAAIALLQKLLLTHPYGLVHGGTLDREVFEKDYKEACEKLKKLEGSVGNVVQETEGQDDEEEEEEEEEDDNDDSENEGEEGSRKKKKKSKKYVLQI